MEFKVALDPAMQFIVNGTLAFGIWTTGFLYFFGHPLWKAALNFSCFAAVASLICLIAG